MCQCGVTSRQDQQVLASFTKTLFFFSCFPFLVQISQILFDSDFEGKVLCAVNE